MSKTMPNDARWANLRIQQLEEAITEASLQLCESDASEAKAAMRIFGKVMDAEAMKRVGI